MARHERAVNTLLGLHSGVAPSLYQAQLSWSGRALVAKHGTHDGSATSGHEHRAGATALFSAVLAAEVRLVKVGIVPGGRLCLMVIKENFDSDEAPQAHSD